MRCHLIIIASLLLTMLPASGRPLAAHALPADSPLHVETCSVPGGGETMLCGTLEVWENRQTRAGRRIPIHLVLLEATGEHPAASPLVVVAGGPGQAATTFVPFLANDSLRARYDILLVDQRGTGGSNPLQCTLEGSDEDLQGFLQGAFPEAAVFERCRRELSLKADLAHYSSLDAAHDLDEVRAALGYARLNLAGGSYGTRASLVYMREYPERVRAATLNGVAPISFENPLYHARAAQRALDLIFAECRNDPACFAAFGDPAKDFREVAARLRGKPAQITIDHPSREEKVTLRLDQESFFEGVRTFMYSVRRNRRLPMVLDRAAKGELEPLLMATLMSTRGIQEILHWGMLLSVTCSEDVDRISEEEIMRETEGTFLGDRRVREQKAACAGWPRSPLPPDWAEDVSVDVPTLLFSGTLDPVTPPEFGELAARHLPKSLHIVAPGGHGVGGPCLDSIAKRFLETARVDTLDTSCVADLELPPFVLEDAENDASRDR